MKITNELSRGEVCVLCEVYRFKAKVMGDNLSYYIDERLWSVLCMYEMVEH